MATGRTTTQRGSSAAWIALPLALAALLAPLALPWGAGPAIAEEPSSLPQGLEEEFEGTPDEGWCELEEEDPLECEEGEEGTEGPYPPEECLLRTARARVLASTSRDRLRLTIRYTSLAPTRAYVDFKARTGQGSLDLGLVRRHVARKGQISLSASLSAPRMERVRAAKRFLVRLDIPAAPSYCRRYYTRRLTVKKVTRSQVVWLQSGSVFGT